MRLIGLIVCLSLIQGCSSSPTPTLVIGHVAPLSGEDRKIGEDQRDGIHLALQELTEAKKQPLAVLHVDGQSSPELTRAEIVRLCSVNRIRCLLLAASSSQTLDLSSTVQKYRVPMLSAAELLPGAPGALLSLDVSTPRSAEMLARFAEEHLKVEHLIILTDRASRYSDQLSSELHRRWQAKEGKQAALHPFDGSVKSPPSEKPKSAFVFTGSAESFRKFLRVERKAPVIFAGESWEAGKLMETLPDAPEVYLTSIYAIEKLTEKGKAFVEKFQRSRGRAPSLFALQGYEMIQIISQALDQQQDQSPLRAETMSNDRTYESLTGKIKVHRRYSIRPQYVLAIEKGKLKVIQSYDPPK